MSADKETALLQSGEASWKWKVLYVTEDRETCPKQLVRRTGDLQTVLLFLPSVAAIAKLSPSTLVNKRLLTMV